MTFKKRFWHVPTLDACRISYKLEHSQNVSYRLRWNYHKLLLLSLLQSAMDTYYKFQPP